MPQFLYFLEGTALPVSAPVAAGYGLGYAFEADPASMEIVGRTPSGKRGMLASVDSERLSYSQDKQTWRRLPDSQVVWVGLWNAHRPTPDALRRQNMIPGKAVELGDGLRWLIPRLSAYVGGEGFSFDLPCYADLSDDGRWINGQVIEEYRPAQQIAQRLHDGMIRAELGLAPRLSSEEVLILSAEILQLNYRIGGLECAMLRLLRLTESLRDIAKAAVDWQTFVEWYEKKTAESDHTGRTPAAGRVAAAGRAPAAGQALASAG